MSKFISGLLEFMSGVILALVIITTVYLTATFLTKEAFAETTNVIELQEIQTPVNENCYNANDLIDHFFIPVKAEIITSLLVEGNVIVNVWVNEDRVFIYTLNSNNVSCYLTHGERIQ